MTAESWGEWLDRYELRECLYPSGESEALGGRAWAPNQADANAALEMAVELRTRIATQPLALRDGDESTALKSISGFFDLFRHLAKGAPKAHYFYELGLRVLNGVVRPFTARWHPVDKAGRLDGTDASFHFRTELLEIQHVLRRFCALLEAMAGMSPSLLVEQGAVDGHAEYLEAFAIHAVQDDAEGSLARLIDAEVVSIRERRNEDGPVLNGVGLALSGGGIRSATFALGVVTELARRGLMDDVDYLSTVSGGGYLGGFITSTVGEASSEDEDRPFRAVFGESDRMEKRPVRTLRNHSKYLVEGGIKTLATLAGTVLYGLITAALLVAPVLLLLVASAASVRHAPDIARAVAWFGVALFAIGYATAQWTVAIRPPSKYWWLFAGGVIGLTLVGIAGLFALPEVTLETGLRVAVLTTLTLVGASLLAFGTVRLRPYAPAALLWTTGVAVMALLLAVGTMADVLWWKLVVAAVVLLLLGLTVDLNGSSPHPFYKERLARTYLLDRAGNTVSHRQPLSGINPSRRAPYHLICAAVNVPGSENPNLRGRRSDFFLFSKHACGSLLTGYLPTTQWLLRGNNEVDLATAMAVSGAAASPNMGRHSIRTFGYVLALLNLRLGYWLRKPGSKAWLLPHRYYYAEIRQRFSEKGRFLNVSDGGHIENLGVFELLRRRCKFIIAVDGEADPQRSFEGLLHVVHLARVDLNTHINPRLDRLRVNAEGIGRSHFELFRIVYPGGKNGLLLYLKASLTGNEPETIRRYRDEHPDFPHESTSKQLYSEHQFEAYRLLGEHIANDLFHRALVGDSVHRVGEWLQRLARHFLRPNE